MNVSKSDLRAMIGCVRVLHRLSLQVAYRARVLPQVPESARLDPGHDAVMMGYDFHLAPDGPKLIEVNTNAGGFLLPHLAAIDDNGDAVKTRRWYRRLQAVFAREYACCSGSRGVPAVMAILDENPPAQFLYPEMLGFARLFMDMGAKVAIVEPTSLRLGSEGIFHDGEKIDFIYNRHTDFYLESAELAAVRHAYLKRQVCLSPNPFHYGLLADKRRLPLWKDQKFLETCGLGGDRIELLTGIVPESFLLAAIDPEEAWRTRQDWVFKPVDRFGSRGVILGRKITRKRFAEFLPTETLLQRYVPPSLTATEKDGPMKTDLRLFVYRNRLLGILARLYRGQVTNMQTPGGGFAMVRWPEKR